MMRKRILLFFFIFCFTVSLFSADIFQGEIYPANDRDYPGVLLPLLKDAKNSIYVIMFLASYYPEYPDSPTNLFLKEMIKAKEKGVKVEVILNQSDREDISHVTVENLKTARYLHLHNIPVYFSPHNITTHAKIVIIDGKFVVIGSTNWSYSAMAKNHETSVVIESPELARYYMKYFEGIKKNCVRFFHPLIEK